MKFRPQIYNAKAKLRYARQLEYIAQLNWYYGKTNGPHGIYTIFQHLHYLACHAPKPIQLKWRAVYKRFLNNYPKLL